MTERIRGSWAFAGVFILLVLASIGSSRADDAVSAPQAPTSQEAASEPAAADNGKWYNPISGYSAPVPDGFAPYARVGGEVLFGKVSSADDASVPSLSMAVYGVEGAIGARWRQLIVGFGLDDQLWRQLTAPAARVTSIFGATS